jgi:hypothetical protein
LKEDGSEFEVKFADMSTILNTAVENLEREETALDADILTPGQYQEAILGITPGQKGLLEIETPEEEAPVIEEPVEKSELELKKDSLKKMVATVPVEIQRATSLENRKLLNRYKEEASKGIINDPDFFMSFDDWLKGETQIGTNVTITEDTDSMQNLAKKEKRQWLKMIDTIPVEVQLAWLKETSLKQVKAVRKYQKEMSKKLIDDPTFFMSYEDWLKEQ